jgi:hypothetical protein
MPPFDRFAAPLQAFVQPVQAPDIGGMLEGTWQGLVKAQISSIHRLGLGKVSCIHQQGTKRVTGWLHPAPRLVVKHTVIQPDRRPQVFKAPRLAPLYDVSSVLSWPHVVQSYAQSIAGKKRAPDMIAGRHWCGFRGEWALISRDRGHAFRAMLGSHFTGSRAGWPTLSWSQA